MRFSAFNICRAEGEELTSLSRETPFAALWLQPPARELKLDRLERLRLYAFAAAVRVCHHPAATLEPVHLEGLGQRFDEPEMGDRLARIDAHLAHAIGAGRRGRHHLAGPVG